MLTESESDPTRLFLSVQLIKKVEWGQTQIDGLDLDGQGKLLNLFEINLQPFQCHSCGVTCHPIVSNKIFRVLS